MRSKDELNRQQARMRTRKARGKPLPKPRRPAKLAPFDVRRAAILEGIVDVNRADTPWDWLRSVSAYRPYGRGWWFKTITELCATGELRVVETRSGDVIQRARRKGGLYV